MKTTYTKKSQMFCFRPQQGLPIMNWIKAQKYADENLKGFPSPTGVTYYEYLVQQKLMKFTTSCFRPQQGLTIMNPYLQNPDKHYLK